MALGIVLGYLFHYSGSIWPGVIAHFANNAVVVCIMYYLTSHGKPVKDAMDDSAALWWLLPSGAVVVALFRAYRIVSNRRNIRKIPPMDGPSIQSNIA
ncbi:MAG: CPBP family intramembrane metalloprotease, partial [Bacteroidetes bacterium]|nr:CPBP family intramembrane metalloprotease [Bacteroidota bacterium]